MRGVSGPRSRKLRRPRSRRGRLVPRRLDRQAGLRRLGSTPHARTFDDVRRGPPDHAPRSTRGRPGLSEPRARASARVKQDLSMPRGSRRSLDRRLSAVRPDSVKRLDVEVRLVGDLHDVRILPRPSKLDLNRDRFVVAKTGREKPRAFVHQRLVNRRLDDSV